MLRQFDHGLSNNCGGDDMYSTDMHEHRDAICVQESHQNQILMLVASVPDVTAARRHGGTGTHRA